MKKLLVFIALMLVASTSNAQSYCYDTNGDGEIDIQDVLCLVNKILGVPNPGEEPQAYLTCPDDNHPHLIDLGLSTKWCCCNIGAQKPEDCGGYYAWGEMEEKEIYNHVTYQYATGVDEDGDGFFDDWHSDDQGGGSWGIWQYLGDDIAGTCYDVAHVKGFGPGKGSWQMPTLYHFQELIDQCSYTWTSKNGVNGALFTGPNGGTLFIPAAGIRLNNELQNVGSEGTYWSSTRFSTHSYDVFFFFFLSDYANYNIVERSYGHTVRPISSN